MRERALELTDRRGAGDGLLHELVIRHEHQHNETMLQTLKLSRAWGLRGRRARVTPARSPGQAAHGPRAGRRARRRVRAGRAGRRLRLRQRAPAPRRRSCRPSAIGRTPITNATFLHFVEGGGYERREWWTDEAWAWKEQYDITHPLHWTDDGREWRMGRLGAARPDKPVVHVSWFEADAFARAHGARLPTEAEWEKAATWDQETGRAALPLGRRGPRSRGARQRRPARLRHRARRRVPGRRVAVRLPRDARRRVGVDAASRFGGYPGFVAHPYREYSEVFFGDDYRVLRGGSWATAARVATPTFRNWDHPQRRQIFSGLRIARDA